MVLMLRRNAKKLYTLIVVLFVLLAVLFFGSSQRANAFAGGDGSPGNPYQVASWSDLNDMRNSLTSSYRLTVDLDQNSTGYSTYASASANSNSGWLPVGDTSTRFQGTFDGDNHTIADLNINRSGTGAIGLFGATNGSATISDLIIQDAVISGASQTGTIIGQNQGAVTNVHSINPTVLATSNAGGIVGQNSGTITLSSTRDGTVSSMGAWGGGIVGIHAGGTISRSWSSATVAANNDAGGLAGHAGSGAIVNSYSTGNVTSYNSSSENSFGGLAGVTGGITNAYASGNVNITGTGTNSGGLYGEGGGTIANTFATGTVTASAPFGGYAGNNGSSNSNSYSVFGTPVGTGNTAGIIDVADATVFMGAAHSHGVYSTWDFDTIWEAHDGGLPTLRGNAEITAPTVSITTPTDHAQSWSPSINWGDSDVCEYKFGSDLWQAVDCAENGTDIPSPGEGNYTLYIRGSYDGSDDQYGTDEIATSLDTTGPTVNAGDNAQTNESFTQSSATASDATSGIDTYQWSKQSGPGSVTFDNAGVLNPTITAVSLDGTYVLRLTITDNAGNVTFDDFTLIWDTTSPGVELTDFPDLKTNQTTADFAFEGTDTLSTPVTFTCKIDGFSFNSCTSPLQYTGLTEGEHTVTIRAIDSVGNMETSDPYIWTIDLTPPTITRIGAAAVTVVQGQPYNDAGATADDAVDGDISGDIEAVSSVNNAVVGTYAVTYNVTDQAGNAAQEVSRTVNVVTNADHNDDGVADGLQDNVSGYQSSLTNKVVAIDVGDDCELTTDDLVRQEDIDTRDPGFTYENGLFDFSASCGTPGFTTTVKLYYYNVTKDNLVARKFDTNTNTYSNIPDATISQTTIDSQTVTVLSYQITDGGELDMDKEVNGEFIDPAGLALADQTGALADTGLNAQIVILVAVTLTTTGAALGLRKQLHSQKS